MSIRKGQAYTCATYWTSPLSNVANIYVMVVKFGSFRLSLARCISELDSPFFDSFDSGGIAVQNQRSASLVHLTRRDECSELYFQKIHGLAPGPQHLIHRCQYKTLHRSHCTGNRPHQLREVREPGLTPLDKRPPVPNTIKYKINT
jgi:hypothetical protein